MKEWVFKAKRYLVVWCQYCRMVGKTHLTYRANFFANTIFSLGWLAATLLTYHFIFQQISAFAGWTWPEMIFLYGVYNLFWGVLVSFFLGGWRLGSAVRFGFLDRILLLPINHFFVVSLHFDPSQIFHALAGLLLLVLAWNQLEVNVPFLRLFAFILLFLNGVFLGWLLSFIFGLTAFWIIENSEARLFFWNIETLAKYPQEVFTRHKALYLLSLIHI